MTSASEDDRSTPPSPRGWNPLRWLLGRRERQPSARGAPAADRALPGDRAPGRGRDGPRAPRRGRRPPPEGRAEDAQARGRVVPAAVRPRGPGRRPGQPPHVCPIFEVGEEGGRPFLAMELLSGETLSARLRRGPLPSAEALDLAEDLLSALGALHDAGVVHRDVKPSNLFLTPHGGKLVDFGLARELPRRRGAQLRSIDGDLTSPGLIIGTPGYMAPEQILGHAVDARADLFAAGILLYEALSGQRPFPGDGPAAALSGTLYDEPLPSSAPRAWSRSTRRSAAPWPRSRPSATPPRGRCPRPSAQALAGGVAGSPAPRARGVRRPPGRARVAARAASRRGRRRGRRRLRDRRARRRQEQPSSASSCDEVRVGAGPRDGGGRPVRRGAGPGRGLPALSRRRGPSAHQPRPRLASGLLRTVRPHHLRADAGRRRARPRRRAAPPGGGGHQGAAHPGGRRLHGSGLPRFPDRPLPRGPAVGGPGQRGPPAPRGLPSRPAADAHRRDVPPGRRRRGQPRPEALRHRPAGARRGPGARARPAHGRRPRGLPRDALPGTPLPILPRTRAPRAHRGAGAVRAQPRRHPRGAGGRGPGRRGVDPRPPGRGARPGAHQGPPGPRASPAGGARPAGAGDRSRWRASAAASS